MRSDTCHVIRHLVEALNPVRKRECTRASKRMKGLLCGKQCILLSRQAHVRGKARGAVAQLVGRNRRCFTAHLRQERVGHLWSYRSKTWARKVFTQWVAQLKWSRLTPSHTFARMGETHLDGLLAHGDKPVSLGDIEGTNLEARNMIRRADGYRDKEYMNLKLIQACSSLGTFRPYGVNPNNS
jgi:transposase